MICPKCGAAVADGAKFCPVCGEPLPSPAPAQAAAPVRETTIQYVQVPPVPIRKLLTNRGLAKFFFLGIITLGIYSIWTMYKVSDDIDTIHGYRDGKKTMNFTAVTMLAPITLGIALLVWNSRLCNRIGDALQSRGINYQISSKTFWGWGFFGTLILVGPFIYYHKLLKAMNLLSENYNVNG